MRGKWANIVKYPLGVGGLCMMFSSHCMQAGNLIVRDFMEFLKLPSNRIILRIRNSKKISHLGA